MKTETRKEIESTPEEALRFKSAAPPPSQDLRDLISSLTKDASCWIRQETALAKTEITEKVSTVGKNATLMVAGGFTLYAGAVVLLLAFSEGLAAAFRTLELGPSVSRLLGMLIVGVIVVGLGLAICVRARKELSMNELKPERTKDTLKETKNWAESKIK